MLLAAHVSCGCLNAESLSISPQLWVVQYEDVYREIGTGMPVCAACEGPNKSQLQCFALACRGCTTVPDKHNLRGTYCW